MLTVIFPAPGMLYMYTFGNHYKPLHPASMCYAYNVFHEVSLVFELVAFYECCG